MKRKLLSLCLLFAAFVQTNSFAQYTYSVTQVVDGGNPGGINTDTDAGTTGWTQVIAGSATANSWSAPIALPFAFDFYGTAVTDVMISGNGVVTFTTTATAIPADANTTLPATGTANIPDNSILGFWDSYTADGTTGSNDAIYYKVFGTAPNRQLWFKYYSYEYGDNGSGGAQCSFAYWGIAIEETTNKVYVCDFNYHSSGAGLTATIGVQENSTSAVEFGAAMEPFGAGSTGTPDNDYYEFTPVLLVNDNAALASIDAPVSPLTTGVQNVDVTIENAGLNTLTSATIDWTVNGTAQTAYSWTGSLAPNATATVTLGTYNFLAGSSTIEAWTSVPNGNADGDTSNDTMAVTLCTSLSGSYTVGGTSPDYTDIVSAVNDLNSCGVSGPVTFNVAAGTYSGAAIIGDVIGSSATNTITFNGAGAATTTMTYDGSGTEYATLALDGTDYVTVKNMTIENTGTSNAYGVHFTNSADFNTVDSCIVSVDNTVTSSLVVAILASGSLTSTSTTGNNANNTTISNTTTVGGYYGIRFYGNSTAAADNSFNTVSNCNITDAYYYGIYFYYQDSPIAEGNTVILTRNTSSGYALYVNYAKHPIVTKNDLHGARTYGIYFSQVNTSTQNSNQRGLIANNMVSSLGFAEGIYLTAADSIDIWHNTVSADNENALWLSSSANEYDVRNNIFVTATGPEVVELDVAPGATDVIDYNVYYHGAAGVLVDIVGTDYVDIPAWIVADPLNNANSVYGDPTFLGAIDLHLGGTIADGAAVVIASIVDDIDGDLRTATPDIGADEYVPPTCFQPNMLTATAITATSADLGWTPTGSETMWDYEWGTSGFSQGSGTLVSGTTSNPSNISGLTPNTTYEFYVRANCGAPVTSTWAGPFSFTTACVAFVAPYTESFNVTGTPSCWSQTATSGGPWEFIQGCGVKNACGTPSDHTGNGGYFAWMDQSSTDSEVSLEMNDVDVSSLTTPYLQFYYSECAGSNIVLQNFLYVEAWNGTSWDTITTINQSTNGWELFGFDISAYTYSTSLVRIRFKAESGGDSWDYEADNLLDDISIIEAPTCFLPTGLSASNLTFTSAELSWTANTGETEWAIEYGPTGFTPGSGTLIPTTTSNPYNLTGLTASTNYDFYIRGICGIGDSSTWSGPGTFYTGYCTPSPSSVDGSGITNVTLGTINNTTGSEPGNYGDYSALSTDVIQGAPAQAFSIEYSTGYTYGTKIWVDWNNDLVFDAGEEVYFGLSASANPTILSGTFAIPATVALGSYTLRIGGTDNNSGPSDACYTGSYGSFEDYTINVIAPCYVAATDVQVACDSYTWIDGMTYTADNNTAIDTVVSNVAGVCDTVYTLDLTINSSSTGTDVQTACDSYTWIDGNTYTASNNTATFVLTNAAGCDSTVTLDLTINNAATGTDVQVACDSYTWINGLTYTNSNNTATYTIAGGAANGCDSIVTLDLTINHSNTGIAAVSACESYTWIDGVTYTSSTNAPTFTLTNTAGCDSVVTLYLTINSPSAGTASITACESYTWIDGITYTASNNSATYTLNNSNGCDSVVTLNLTINNAVTNTITATECESYTSAAGNTYTSTGMYTEMFTAANGCDSILTLDLTITNANYTVSVSSGIHLTSNQPGATYQWIDCTNGNTPIAGATNQVYIATANGDYACEVTYQNCTGTSTCVTVNTVGVEDATASFASVYPNPVNDLLTITLSDKANAQFELIDIHGKIVISANTITSGQKVDFSNLESGIYFVRLIADNNTMIKRVVKH
ncbi:MAG: T9SS type A sorting domain-containing protein [Putridiphycobacter sp.]|nr:T9SS type A sorting domain-containing protein [Putridiphycobacter sp.]